MIKLIMFIGLAITMLGLVAYTDSVTNETVPNCPTNTPTPSRTPPPTLTSTPTETEIPSETPTATSTETDTPTATATPTETETPTPTSTNTGIPTSTETVTTTPTYTFTPTQTEVVPTVTATPKPPQAGDANNKIPYSGRLLGTIYMDEIDYNIYMGVKGNDGILMLPSNERGVAVYENVLWVHRAWNTGWLHLNIGDEVVITINGYDIAYRIVDSKDLPYGIYPPNDAWYIATCVSNDGKYWTGIRIYKIERIK